MVLEAALIGLLYFCIADFDFSYRVKKLQLK